MYLLWTALDPPGATEPARDGNQALAHGVYSEAELFKSYHAQE